MKYDNVLSLLAYWQEFEAVEESDDFARFAVWLSRRVNVHNNVRTNPRDTPPNTVEDSIDAVQHGTEHTSHSSFQTLSDSQREEMLHYYRYLPLDSKITAQLTRMYRFASLYTKKAFQDLDLGSVHEFGVLACIEGAGTLSKTEVIHFNLLEKTTGTELMKRFVKIGFIEEFGDENDKRSKRVRITERGREEFYKAISRLQDVSKIVVGNLEDPQKQDIADAFDTLNDFHSTIYFDQSDSSLAEIVQKNILQSP
jgi:DNA-binding MarR family transcriptional regulator